MKRTPKSNLTPKQQLQEAEASEPFFLLCEFVRQRGEVDGTADELMPEFNAFTKSKGKPELFRSPIILARMIKRYLEVFPQKGIKVRLYRKHFLPQIYELKAAVISRTTTI
jgi:hypothetical protein